MALELAVSSAKKKGTTFYTLHVQEDGAPLPQAGAYLDIEKDGEVWLENQEFVNSAWSNATSPDKNDSNPYTFGGKATFRVARTGTAEWSNEAEL
jgi:hypothetical protein